MMKCQRESLESEIRSWMLQQGDTTIHESIDLFEFASTGRGFVAKK